MTDDFSKAPKSLGEVRANKAANARLWSPRDVLIHVLRELDAGAIKNLDILIVCWREEDENDADEKVTGYSQSSPGCLEVLGVLSRTAFKIQHGD